MNTYMMEQMNILWGWSQIVYRRENEKGVSGEEDKDKGLGIGL